jgi:hypothetical protein
MRSAKLAQLVLLAFAYTDQRTELTESMPELPAAAVVPASGGSEPRLISRPRSARPRTMTCGCTRLRPVSYELENGLVKTTRVYLMANVLFEQIRPAVGQ